MEEKLNHPADLNFLMEEFDADVWAHEFVKLNSASDVDTIRAWFACAIMAGYDQAKREKK